MECKFDTESHMKTLHHELNKINTKMLSNEKNEKLIERKGIRLLTYNIFLRPPPIKNNEDDYKNERIEDFCKVINDFDIICLQEMFGTYNSRKHELIRAANLQGFFFYVDTPTPSFISKYMVDGGLLILSRFPIVESCFYPYTYGVLSDSLAEKGILYAKIKLGDNYLHLMTTHLQASYFDSTDYHWNVSWDARYDQLHEVNNIVREILKHYYTYQIDKVLFVGDFNVDAQKYKFKKPKKVRDWNQLLNEYDNMFNILQSYELVLRDIFPYYNLCHPITYGEFEDDTILTWIDDRGSKQTLDYIFEVFINHEDEKNKQQKNLFIEPNSIRVEKFLVADYPVFLEDSKKKNRLYRTLSDHYGLSVEIHIKDSKVSPSLESEVKHKSDDCVLDIIDENVRLLVEN